MTKDSSRCKVSAIESAVDFEKSPPLELPPVKTLLLERDYRTNIIRFMEYMPIDLDESVREKYFCHNFH